MNKATGGERKVEATRGEKRGSLWVSRRRERIGEKRVRNPKVSVGRMIRNNAKTTGCGHTQKIEKQLVHWNSGRGWGLTTERMSGGENNSLTPGSGGKTQSQDQV